MTITATQIATAINCPAARAVKWAGPLSTAMDQYGIDTPTRQAAFLAQIGHESGKLVFTRELWGPTPVQQRYEGREDLGNTEEGDGYKFRGRGLIQVTGRANYKVCGDALGFDLITTPEALERPDLASLSAAWYWQTHGCNELADAGEFETITKRINGGLNGYAERCALWDSAKEALEVA